MNIVMFTNTFTPHVGGVARSVNGLAEGLRAAGHRVLVVAPDFPGMEPDPEVIRVPAIQRFGGSDFSVPLPLSRPLERDLRAFELDIVHSHHPFLLGDTALRASALHNVPAVFTYHTRYELYSHYAATDSPLLQRLAVNLALGYCRLCNAVIAPSKSIAAYLRGKIAEVPIEVIPSGVSVEQFASGDGGAVRARLGIAEEAFVVGHVGRLALEKNLPYLARSIIRFVSTNERAEVVVAGGGAMAEVVREMFDTAELGGRLHLTGVLKGQDLADTYAAMDVFAFSSHSETQGLVLAEAMAAGVSVVALDATGVREIVEDGVNGRLLAANADERAFAEALAAVAQADAVERTRLSEAARATAERYAWPNCVRDTLSLYERVLASKVHSGNVESSAWEAARRSLQREWAILGKFASSASDAVMSLGNETNARANSRPGRTPQWTRPR